MHPQQYETKTRAHAASAWVKRGADSEGLGWASSVAQSCLTLGDPLDGSPPGSSVHGDSPGRKAGVGCHALLQGIFLTQGWDPGVLRPQADSLPISHQGSQLGAGDQSRVSDLTSRGCAGSAWKPADQLGAWQKSQPEMVVGGGWWVRPERGTAGVPLVGKCQTLSDTFGT